VRERECVRGREMREGESVYVCMCDGQCV
jgi:hypothetical protein